MQIFSLLRRQLKDDVIIEILDEMNAEVIYDFDRSHENIADVFWAQAKEHGITLRFNEEQRLTTVFVYVQPIEGHQAVNPSRIEDIIFFRSSSEVTVHADSHQIPFLTGSRPAGFPPPGNWIRLDYTHHQVHYDFRGGELSLITVMSADESQSA